MREEWRCALITSGELCVTAPGTALMLLLCANSWDMPTQEVSATTLEGFMSPNVSLLQVV